MRIGIWVCFALWASIANAQSFNSDTALSLDATARGDLSRLQRQSEKMTATVQRQSAKTLDQLQRKEASLQRLIAQSDTVAGKLEAETLKQYATWQQRIHSLTSTASPLKEYLPHLDSLQTAVHFLSGSELPRGLSQEQWTSLQALNGKLSTLSASLQQASEISRFLGERQASLQRQLSRLGMTQQLLSFKKQVYYYKDQFTQFKAQLDDPNRLASHVLALLQSRQDFQNYFRKNSYLASLFRLPGAEPLPIDKAVPGLQSRASVAESIKARVGQPVDFSAVVDQKDNTGAGPLGAGMQQAQQQMDTWKQKVANIGGGNSATDMPDFQPNSQHNKTFFQRIQLGLDCQTRNSSYFIPAISTFGLSLGYTINSRSIAGIGAGYLLGWGQPFNHIAFSSQGTNLRSFFNWRIRSSLWASGGFEMNYYNAFSSISQLRVISAWQSSALIGLMKRYKTGSKQGNVQLLFDALYNQHVPHSQPLVFRVGYTLN